MAAARRHRAPRVPGGGPGAAERDRLVVVDLRSRLVGRLGFTPPAAPTLVGAEQRACDGYTERTVAFEGAEGAVPALLMLPDRPSGGAVVVHHQHASQWHLGKSEVAGRAGDPWQAFGPALARHGVTVLAADTPGFEDRRRGPAGIDARPTDPHDYLAAMAHRLVQGGLLMTTVLADAAAAHAALCAMRDVDPARVGTLGHSMGGATALFHAALDPRVAFAAVSGAACTYRHRIAIGTGIEAAQVIPGVLGIGDLDDVVTLVAPRPLLLCSATEDKYSADAPVIADAAAAAYEALGAGPALRHERFAGGHALTEERFAAIVGWTVARASGEVRYSV